jgi:protocatechuate 3,4-dioxygenase beta subunit
MPRGRVLSGVLMLLASAIVSGPLAAQALSPRPRDMRGPYYPDTLPSDQDADLTRIQGLDGRASGRPLTFGGRVLDTRGTPLPAIRVEIWQTDHNGRYLHSGSQSPRPRDPFFQGFGVSISDSEGRYAFRTVMPVDYGSRPPHIHARLVKADRELLVTQIYFPGQTREPGVSPAWARQREAAQTMRIVADDGERGLVGEFDFVLAAAAP